MWIFKCECSLQVRLILDLVYNFSTNSSVALYVAFISVEEEEIYMSDLW